ncbi:hypothetical protein AB0G02_40715, partial [Actinosynnema sp. NPDC023658]|uniref:hypothetical protein n=1 Tax=Actinosynnema sp. NPDC023658 TaxID=3155465 RepID=UPI0033F76D0E
MGASDWRYHVGYQPDVGRAFAEIQQEVPANGDYYRGLGDRHASASAADLEAARHTEVFWEEDDAALGVQPEELAPPVGVHPGDGGVHQPPRRH